MERRVTSYLPNAVANFGYERLPSHDERYGLSDEYMDVVYKLWEGRWEDDAVLRDTARGIYADPDKVHPIKHTGKHFTVAGHHLSEPSPQRTTCCFRRAHQPGVEGLRQPTPNVFSSSNHGLACGGPPALFPMFVPKPPARAVALMTFGSSKGYPR